MEFDKVTVLNENTPSLSNGQSNNTNNLMNENSPVTATGVPHYTVNPVQAHHGPSTEGSELLHYFDLPGELKQEGMTNNGLNGPRIPMGLHPYGFPPAIPLGRGIGNGNENMGPLSGGLPVLPYPSQYPNQFAANMLSYQQQQQQQQQQHTPQKQGNWPMPPSPHQMPPYPLSMNLFNHFPGHFPGHFGGPQGIVMGQQMNGNMTPHNGSSSPPNVTNNSIPAMSNPSMTTNTKSPQVIYRNLFHTMHCKLPNDGVEWEGCRVYISDLVGYSGNAKRFKKKPEKGEKALTLECTVLTSNDQSAQQCLSCKDYFETQKYYKANPECIGRIVLVKNNAPIRVENGQFKILIKMMCCCVHHTVDYFNFKLDLFTGDAEKPSTLVFSSKIPLSVKQWRKSNQKKEECVMFLEPKSTVL